MTPVNDRTNRNEQLFTKLRERREAMGVSVSDMARQLGWSKAYVSMLERGERELSPELYAEMTEVLNAMERERRERLPAVRKAVQSIWNMPELVAMRRQQ